MNKEQQTFSFIFADTLECVLLAIDNHGLEVRCLVAERPQHAGRHQPQDQSDRQERPSMCHLRIMIVLLRRIGFCCPAVLLRIHSGVDCGSVRTRQPRPRSLTLWDLTETGEGAAGAYAWGATLLKFQMDAQETWCSCMQLEAGGGARAMHWRREVRVSAWPCVGSERCAATRRRGDRCRRDAAGQVGVRARAVFYCVAV